MQHKFENQNFFKRKVKPNVRFFYFGGVGGCNRLCFFYCVKFLSTPLKVWCCLASISWQRLRPTASKAARHWTEHQEQLFTIRQCGVSVTLNADPHKKKKNNGLRECQMSHDIIIYKWGPPSFNWIRFHGRAFLQRCIFVAWTRQLNVNGRVRWKDRDAI